MKIFYLIIIGFVVIHCPSGLASELDEKLALVNKVYQLKSKECLKVTEKDKESIEYTVGKLLFESKSLSGNRDISCSNCHLDQFGSADGLPIAVGVGGTGSGMERLNNSNGVLVQRNTISLKGRGDKAFEALFWDGKVQREHGRVVSQFGNLLPDKFSTALSVAAILPIMERDELIGKQSFFHANEIERSVEDKLYLERYLAISDTLKSRFNQPDNEEDNSIRGALRKTGIDISNLELADIGNLLAEFIKLNFPCNESAWDRYIYGEVKALTEDQKAGAIIFYGKGRCASCHSGEFFSDFQFHSIGVPQGEFGPHTRHRDIGRAAVTNRIKDLYQFRTPPLTSVSETAPYGHNGVFDTLEEIIIHHFNPFAFYRNNDDYFSKDYFVLGKLLGSRDSILNTIDIQTEKEISQLVTFLEAL